MARWDAKRMLKLCSSVDCVLPCNASILTCRMKLLNSPSRNWLATAAPSVLSTPIVRSTSYSSRVSLSASAPVKMQNLLRLYASSTGTTLRTTTSFWPHSSGFRVRCTENEPTWWALLTDFPWSLSNWRQLINVLKMPITITCATTRIPFHRSSGITLSSSSPMGIRAGSAAWRLAGNISSSGRRSATRKKRVSSRSKPWFAAPAKSAAC